MRLIMFYSLLLSTIVVETLCGECPRITSKNVKIVYKYPEQGRPSHQHPIRPGTKAYLECEPFYEYSIIAPDPPKGEITCLEDGTWDLPVFNCVPECGSTTGSENIQIADNSPPGHGTFPWHVGVYHIDWMTGEFEHVCGGSLISTELVISAAHCYYSDTEKRLQYARNYAVAAGKLSRDYYETESNQQTSQVQKIYVPNDYEGPRSSQLEDIVILRLAQSFEMTSFVRPVCIDFGNNSTTEQFDTGKIGKLMGWGRNARGDPCEELQEISLPNIDHDSCLNTNTENFEYVLTEDETCAGRSEGSSICDADNGSGLCFQSDERWYLGGIVSVISYNQNGRRGRYNDRYYTAFNSVANHTPWIQSVQNDAEIPLDEKPRKIDKPQSCILPEPANSGNFGHESCNYVPGMTFPMGSALEFNCEKGYFLQGNSTSICQHAIWSPRPTCIKLKYCPPIPPSDHLEAVCQHDNRIVSCELDVVPGTIAALQCADKYRINFNGDNSRLIQFICSANGTWNTDPASYYCTRECGIAPVIDNFAHSVNGTEIYAGDVPWPVYTYREVGEKPKGSWCIGTLVKPDLVITIGDCKKHLGSHDTRQNIEDLRVVDTFDGLLGDDFISNRSYHQKHSVKNYRLHESYHDSPDDLNNIMALRLETPFIPKRYVSPICIDWDLKLDIPRVGELGMVLFYIKDKLSRYATLVIDNEECNRLLDANVYRRITHNEFCIEGPRDLENKVHFAVRRNGVWYLAGFTMNHFVDEKQSRLFNIMTKTGYHINWIKQVGEDL